MNIKDFTKKYKNQKTKSLESLKDRWIAESKADDLLGSPIMTGVLLSDALINGVQIDSVSEDVRQAFQGLMKGKVDSYSELRELVVEKYEKSPQSVEGLISKIQGQYGENVFIEKIGSGAELAKDGSQEGWDVKIPRDYGNEYIQVKVYNDPNAVIEHIQRVNEKVSNGGIEDVKQINFAVNSDIFEEVNEKVNELGLENTVYNIGKSRDEIRGTLESGFESINESTLFDEFFSEVLASSFTATAIHAASNAFLVWKYNKEKSQAIEDTVYSSLISGGGVTSAVVTRAIITEAAALTELELLGTLLGPVGLVASVGAGYTAREYLKRIASRKDLQSRLNQDLIKNKEILINLKSTFREKESA
jgi:hypothetical protein